MSCARVNPPGFTDGNASPSKTRHSRIASQISLFAKKGLSGTPGDKRGTVSGTASARLSMGSFEELLEVPQGLGFRVVAAPDWVDFFSRLWAHSTLDARSSSADSIRASSSARDLQIVEFGTCRHVCVCPETSYPRRYRASSDKGCPETKKAQLEKSYQSTGRIFRPREILPVFEKSYQFLDW